MEAELASLEETPTPVSLHPATLDRYIETVNALADTMATHAGAVDDRGPLVADFRSLVHSVIVHPKGPREGFEVEVKGKLAALVGAGLFPEAHRDSGGYMGAGEGLSTKTGNSGAKSMKAAEHDAPVSCVGDTKLW